VLVAALLGWCLAAAFDLQERIAGLSQSLRLELWQVDELPLVLTVLGGGLAWYAWRRWQETVALLAHNRELALQLIEVQERERLVLARELHDELAQHCTAIRVEAAYLRHADDATALKASAASISESSRQLLDSLRGILRRLRPVELDELGLEAAVRALASAARPAPVCTAGWSPRASWAAWGRPSTWRCTAWRRRPCPMSSAMPRPAGPCCSCGGRAMRWSCASRTMAAASPGPAQPRPGAAGGLGTRGPTGRRPLHRPVPLGGAALCLRVPVWPVAEGAR
jgi:hypothetical protein